MNKITFAIALMLGCASCCIAQEQQEEKEVNIVGYFSKNDTMRYVATCGKYRVMGNDTTITNFYTKEFDFVVIDSTASSYKFEMIPLNLENGSKDTKGADAFTTYTWEVLKKKHPIFTTDEMGGDLHLDNWKAIGKELTKMLDKILKQKNKFDSEDESISLDKLQSTMEFAMSTSAGVLSRIPEVQNLFLFHGRALELGFTETEDSTNYPTTLRTFASYEDVEEGDEGNYEGDYFIQYSSDVKVEKNAFKGVLGVFSNLISDNKDTKNKLEETVTSDVNAGEFYEAHMFFNGWPKEVTRNKYADMSGLHNVEFCGIEWTRRFWK
ncbi:MAG: hypothetical protein K6E54_02895 [Bacteroidaceae bacterium]|nr:hypothetical protein [Bacteroidaceae bacterium]